MRLVTAFVRAMRPHQWTKNLFVFAPLLFAQQATQEGRLLRVAATFAVFCLVASAVYLMNDIVDREADRNHPKKSRRPIASGELPVAAAIAGAVVLFVGGLAWTRFGLGSNRIAAVLVVYAVIQVAYSFGLKRLVILDVLCIASGFVLRLLAGGVASWAPLSEWILLCTIFLSLFLALCKRRHEVTSLGDGASGHRAALADYPLALLDQLISVATSATLVTYALYTVDELTAQSHRLPMAQGGFPVLTVTIPFVIYGLFRYLFLVYRRGLGGSPTSTLAKDPLSLANGALYGLTVMVIFRMAASG